MCPIKHREFRDLILKYSLSLSNRTGISGHFDFQEFKNTKMTMSNPKICIIELLDRPNYT